MQIRKEDALTPALSRGERAGVRADLFSNCMVTV